ncbi:MAG: hypothetical protein GXP03_08005 [Alphaproteobacteria bacterium]|nr:hypothetical protein [Alphaproteobacteria bacterium]
MLKHSTYLKIVKASAAYDLLITAAFATPWSFAFLAAQLAWLHDLVGAGGAVIPGGIFVTLFANFFGSVVVIWSIYRLRHASVTVGRYDGAARLLFSFWQFNALMAGASTLLIPILVIEVVLAVLQWLPVSSEVQKPTVTD